MHFVILVIFSLFFSNIALGAGYWCYAQAPSNDRVLKWGPTLEDAKSWSRSQCNFQYGPGCQVVQCYESSPYKYSCVGSRFECETTIGGFRAWGDNEIMTRTVAKNSCSRKWGSQDCVVSCYPNFTPPREDATPEDLLNAATFSED